MTAKEHKARAKKIWRSAAVSGAIPAIARALRRGLRATAAFSFAFVAFFRG